MYLIYSLQVIIGALRVADVQPSQVNALEMHGTGTALGDPIEVGAALAVLQNIASAIHLSAAKSRVGHAEPASGAVGMLQVRSLIQFSIKYVSACASCLINVSDPCSLITSYKVGFWFKPSVRISTYYCTLISP